MREKVIFKNAQRAKDRDDNKVAHGQTSNLAFLPGIRSYQPLDRWGRVLPTGTNITTEYGEMTLYDGRMTVVDSEYFDSLVEQHSKRKEYIEKLTDGFLAAGDSLCISTIGPYFDWLRNGHPQGANRALFKKCIMLEGYNNDQAEDLINTLVPVDGTPNRIKTFTNTSQAFNDSLSKLEWVLRYVGIVFTGENPVTVPDVPINPQRTIYDPNRDASNEAKMEVQKNRGLDNATATAIMG